MASMRMVVFLHPVLCQSLAMRKLLAPLLLCLVPALASAGEITSTYTKFDLDTCAVIEKGDEYVYAGTWSCPGEGGFDIVQSYGDDRAYVAFGRDATKHCAFRKTFSPFNTALSPVEWRMRDGKPFAAIERWSVVIDENGNSNTWLVVNALRDGDSCHVNYVAGSYPDANAVARIMADDSENFDCLTDTPTVDSKVGAPPIPLVSCMELEPE
jgi:hypothetical protein